MTKENYLFSLRKFHVEIHDLMCLDNIPFDSASYALLQAACNCLDFALSHSEDFNRDKL